jgi:hypothetical protein
LISRSKSYVLCSYRQADKSRLSEKELKRLKTDQAHSTTAFDAEKTEIKAQLRKFRTQHALITRELEISAAINTEKNDIQAKLNDRIKSIKDQMTNMTGNYRSKLEKFIRDMVEFTQAKSTTEDVKDVKRLVDNMFQEILQSYIMHERHCIKEIQLVNQECKQTKSMCERYRTELSTRTESKDEGKTKEEADNLPRLQKMVSDIN